MKIERTMCRKPILMAVSFLGFNLLFANLPAADCSGKGNFNGTILQPPIFDCQYISLKIFMNTHLYEK